jgi:hypothetical protein
VLATVPVSGTAGGLTLLDWAAAQRPDFLPASASWGSVPYLNGGPTMHSPVPWIGLAAFAATFLLPWLDARGLLDGPRTIRRRPRRQVCADCAAPWTSGHRCADWTEAAAGEPVVPLQPQPPSEPPRLRVRLTRTDQPALPRRRRP